MPSGRYLSWSNSTLSITTGNYVQGHDPVFGGTRKASVQWVQQEDRDEIEMQYENRQQGEPDLPHLDDRIVSMIPHIPACKVEEK